MSLSKRLSRGQPQTSEEAAKVLALLQGNTSTVDLGDVANDRESKPGPWLSCRVEPGPSRKQLSASLGRDPRPVVLDLDVDHFAFGLDRDEHSASTIFCCILDEIAEQFVEILALHSDLRVMISGDVDRDAFVKAVDSSFHSFQAFEDASARLGGGTAADRSCPGEMVIDLPAHHEGFSANSIGKIRRPCRG